MQKVFQLHNLKLFKNNSTDDCTNILSNENKNKSDLTCRNIHSISQRRENRGFISIQALRY